jgi:hypothetical protein
MVKHGDQQEIVIFFMENEALVANLNFRCLRNSFLAYLSPITTFYKKLVHNCNL